MAVHINAVKVSDGTGRDTYIDRVDEVRKGREMLVTLSPNRPFKHWDLRSPSPALSTSKGLTAADMMRTKRSLSYSRGGRGWQDSLDMEERRRTQQSLGYSVRAAGLSSSRAASASAPMRQAEMNGPSSMMMMQDLGIEPDLLSESRRGGRTPPPTAARVGRGGGASLGLASRNMSRTHTGSFAWRPVGPVIR